jgi:hypothetical protein
MSYRNDLSSMLHRFLRGHRGSRFFCDGGITWSQGPKKRPPKTAAEAANDDRLMVQRLRRSPNRAAHQLADILEICENGNRCLSGACTKCRRALQRAFVEPLEELYHDHGGDMCAFNAVWTRAAIPDGRLHEQDIFEGTRRRLNRAARRSRMRIIAGFDISANEHEDGEFEPYYAPHAYGFVAGKYMRRGEMDFRPFFPPDDLTPRPLRITKLDGNLTAFAYALKPDFFRRDALHQRFDSDGCRSRFSTREKPMREPQRVELAIALHRAGLTNRIFLHGYDLIIANGRLKIVPT